MNVRRWGWAVCLAVAVVTLLGAGVQRAAAITFQPGPPLGDFNGDGKTDLLWRHTSGLVYLWLLDGMNVLDQGLVGNVSTDWTIVGVGDFDGDGKADILWQHTSGLVYIWRMDGLTVLAEGSIGGVGPGWTIVGVGDFDGDGKADILWQHTSGLVYIWLMNGLTVSTAGVAGGVGPGWSIVGVGDFNGDHHADILWQDTSGVVYIWLMNGFTVLGQGSPGMLGSPWHIVGVGDFNGPDGPPAAGPNGMPTSKADILWQNTTTGDVSIWIMNGLTIIDQGSPGTLGSPWHIVGAGDFNGDHFDDILWWNSTSGAVQEWLLNGFNLLSMVFPGSASTDWHLQNQVPAITEGASTSVTMSENGSPTAFSLTLHATDPDGDTVAWSISSAASHGTASASGTGPSNAIGYTPTTNYHGSDSFVVEVSDGHGGTATITVNVTIVVCPTITVSGTIPALTFNTAMATATFTQTGGNGTITWSATGLPTGVTINSSSGDVTGTPTVSGTFNATITATDAGNCTGSKNVTVTVNRPPAFTSASTATFAPGLAGQTFTVTTTGFPTNTITRTGTLPSGVTFTDNGNNTATIAGTPAAGTQASSPYAWIITAANGVPPNAVQNPFTFNVVCPTITVSGTIPALTFNTAMATATFTQTGGNGTITWSATGLPTGVTINSSSGDVTGTPTVSGTFNATITATDAGNCTGSKNVTVTVNRPPAFTSASTATFAPGLAGQTFTVTTTGFPTNTITRTGTLPSGVTFTDNGNNTATIAGTPAAGTQASSPYAWIITAANGVPPNAVQNPFTFNVVCPTITVSGTIPALTFNTAMATATFTQTGGNGTITWSATGLPTGVTINSSSGDVTGTPTVSGTFNATITATDAGNCTGSKNVTVTVNRPPAFTSASTATFAPGLAGQTFTVTTTGFPTNTITRTGTLPSGVTFTDNGNNTATIAGTPAAGTQASSPYAWIITAANGVPPNAVQNPFTFNVVCPTITVSGTIPALTFNTAMATATFTQTGGNGTITWSSSGLPTGVSINSSSGAVTGTPTVSGTFNATITATDAGNCTGSKNVTVTVNRPPAFTSASTATFAPGLAGQTFTVTTTGFPTNTITRTGTLPSGVTFTDNGNNTATIAGTPAAGTQASSPYAWIITAANGVPPNAVQNPFTFNVVCPTITVSGTIPALTFNTAMATATFTRVGGNGTISWSSSGLPTNTSINSANGQVTGTPNVTGTFNVTITATDAGGCTGSTNQSVTVAPVATGDAYSGLVDNTQLVITGGTTASPATPFVGATSKITTNDLPSGGVSATAGTFATSAGGSVTIANDGTFIYTPKANPGAARTTSDSFTYTVFSNTGGGAAVTSAAATVNLTLVGRVWYVLNTAGGGGNGQSQSPFNTLAAAIAASTAGATAIDTDTLYVYQGDGTTTNLATASILKTLQSFIGQGVALVVNSNTLVAAGNFPLIGNTLTLANTVTVNGIDMSTGAASGLVGTSTTGLAVTVRNLTTTTGTAVNLNGTNGTVTMTSVTASGGTTNISLTNVAGTVTMNGGALSGASGRAIDISGAPGTANITYAGTISNSGTGIGVANKSGGTVTFSGSSKTLNTGANTAVTLSSNTNATITFSGGGLGITTAAGAGFSATGGGTVTVTTGANPNTITSTSGTALNVVSTTIGASGLTFRSISAGTGAGSAGSGIILDTTGSSGGLTVTGNSSGFCGGSVSPAHATDVADCTGGTIQHKTGADNTTAGVGIYLNSTSNVSLTRMQLNDFDNFAIRGSNVTGFTLSNSHISGQNGNNDAVNEGSISFDELTGSASLTSVTISGGWEDNLRLLNTTGALNRLTLSNCTIGANSASFGNAALNMQVQGAGTMKVTVDGCIFTGSRSHFVQYLLNGNSTPTGDFVFTNNTITQSMASIAGAGGVFVSGSANASPTFTFNIQDNIIHSGTQTITGGVINVSHLFGGTYNGTIDGNIIGTAGVVGSGSTQGNGISIIQVGGGTYTVHVTNNTIRRYNNMGIEVQVGDNTTGGNGTVNATITGNTVAEPDSFALHGLRLNIGTTAADAMFVCASIGGAGALKNTLTGSGVVANGGFDVRSQQRFNTTIRLPGYGGANNDNAAVGTFLSGQNTFTTSSISQNVAGGGGGYVGGAACP